MSELGPIHLALLIGRTIAIPAPQPVTDALLSAQVTVAAGQRSGFQLSFDLSKQGLLNSALLPAGYFDPKTRVILVVTIRGVPHVLIDGVMTRQEVAVSNDPGNSTLTVTGEDLTVLMDLDEQTGKTLFPAIPDMARVTLLVAKYAQYGIIPAVLPPKIFTVPVPTERVNSEKGTDLAYITELAKNNGYVFYLDPGPVPGISKAYWGPEIRIGVPQPALNVNFDHLSNVDSLTFSFDGTAREQPVVNVQIPLTKISIPVPVPQLDLLRPPLAVKPAPALRTRAINDTAKKDMATATAETLAKAAESADAVTGSGQLDVLRYGHVLRARELVGVRGAGPAYDGLYYVKSVTHNVQRGQFTQNFTLARDGLISITPMVPP